MDSDNKAYLYATKNNPLTAHSPIGLFDSGVGGLSVYRHLQQLLPDEQYLYFADTLNVPYGSRSSEQISELTLQAVDWLVAHDCKLVVIACNSASAHGLALARERYPNIAIVGLVPALKPAVKTSQTKKVAVLATQATLDGYLLNEVIDEVATPNDTQVIKWYEPDLVPWVEAGMPTDSPTAQKLKQQLHEFYAQGADQLVLGCTHYPFFRDFLQAEISQQKMDVTVVDSGRAIAKRVHNLLSDRGLLAKKYPLINSNQQNSLAYPTQTETMATKKATWQQDAQLTIGELSFYASLYDDKLGEVVKRLLEQTGKDDTDVG